MKVIKAIIMLTLLFLFLFAALARGEGVKYKNYKIYNEKGDIVRRVECSYGICTAYDNRWYPRERWQEPLDDYDNNTITDVETGQDRYSVGGTDYN